MVMVSPYSKSLKSASAEVFNWNLLNEVDYARHLFACTPKDNVCACGAQWQTHYGCYVGRTFFIGPCKTMLGGEHPLTKHDILTCVCTKVFVGWQAIVFVLKLVVCSKPVAVGLGANKYWVSIVE